MAKTHPIPTDPRFKNLTGKRFGRLKVISYAGRVYGRKSWNCVCKCGKTLVVGGSNMRSGNTASCGCLKIDTTIATQTTHGYSRHRRPTTEYRTWLRMRDRCRNPKNPDFSYYGGRGIKVCERWDNFVIFLADIGPRPSLKHELDRYPDQNGNYEPGNVRWATRTQQTRNMRSNLRLTFRGETHCLSEWAEMLKMPSRTLQARLAKLHWSVERTLSTPVRPMLRTAKKKLNLAGGRVSDGERSLSATAEPQQGEFAWE